MFGIAMAAHAIEVPDAIRQLVEEEFPGATITEIRKDTWKGHPVTEVKFITTDGDEYEMIISEDGKVLEIEEEKGLPWLGGELKIGLGAMVERDIYKGVDTEVEPVPFLNYENGRFELTAYDGLDANYTFFRSDRLSIAAGGYYLMGEGYDPEDSDDLEGMEDLDDLYGASLSMETRVADWEISLEFLQDLSGETDGQAVELSLAHTWFAGGFEFRPQLSLTWLSEKTVDYFYGVSAREARAGRPAYSPDASYEAELELMIQRPIFGAFTAVGIVSVSTFGSDIKDSPIVDEDYGWEGVFGVMYTF